MMTKQHYQKFATALSKCTDNEQRELILSYLLPVFQKDNARFSEGVFREWVRRETNGESLKGLKSGASKKF
jgi:hypothetical protein